METVSVRAGKILRLGALAAALATSGGCRSFHPLLDETQPYWVRTAWIEKAVPWEDAERAWKKHDYRFFELSAGGWCEVPGVTNWPLACDREYGFFTWRIPKDKPLYWHTCDRDAFGERLLRYSTLYNECLSELLDDPRLGVVPDAAEMCPEELVDSLALSLRSAWSYPKTTYSWDSPASVPGENPRIALAHHAFSRLMELGVTAFPALVRSAGDKRRSVSWGEWCPPNVGMNCRSIIWTQVESVPTASYKWRKGADGDHHTEPSFVADVGLQRWWRARKDWPLARMRVEALRWRIAEEQRIGFPTPADEAELLTPIRQALSEAEAEADALGSQPKPHR